MIRVLVDIEKIIDISLQLEVIVVKIQKDAGGLTDSYLCLYFRRFASRASRSAAAPPPPPLDGGFVGGPVGGGC